MKRLRITDYGLRICLVILLTVGAALWLAVPQSQATAAGKKQAELKRQMQRLERAVSTSLQQVFGNRPFAVLQEPKSVYLAGFGVMVHAEVNLYPMRFVFPFAPNPYSEKELKTEREQKRKRLKQLQSRLRELLLAESAELTQLGAEENLAVVIHLFNSRPYPEIPSQVVLQAQRKALLELQDQGHKPEPAELARVISLRQF